MLIDLNNILNCRGMRRHFSDDLLLNIKLANLAIWFSKNKNFWILLPVLPECGDSVGREIKGIWLLRRHGNSSPNIQTSSPRCGKDIVTVTDELINILKGLIHNLGVYHEGFSLRVNCIEDTFLIVSTFFGKLFFVKANLRLVFILVY